jgi:hypothetical protein
VPDGIGSPEPHLISGLEHPYAVVRFLSLVHKMLAIAAESQKDVAFHGVRRADENISDPSSGWVRRTLQESICLLRFKIRNGHRTDARIVKVPQGLIDNVWRGEFGVIIDGEHNLARGEAGSFIPAGDVSKRLLVAEESRLRELRGHHRCGTVRGAVVNDHQFRPTGLLQGGTDRQPQLLLAIPGGDDN